MNKHELKELLDNYLTVEVEHATDVCLSGTRITTFVTIKFDGQAVTESSDVAVIDHVAYCEDSEE